MIIADVNQKKNGCKDCMVGCPPTTQRYTCSRAGCCITIFFFFVRTYEVTLHFDPAEKQCPASADESVRHFALSTRPCVHSRAHYHLSSLFVSVDYARGLVPSLPTFSSLCLGFFCYLLRTLFCSYVLSPRLCCPYLVSCYIVFFFFLAMVMCQGFEWTSHSSSVECRLPF